MEELSRLTVEQGMDVYVFAPVEEPRTAQLRRFAEAVAPQVRKEAERLRGA